MLDSDQEPSYNLSKNLLLLPRILKLIKDMVDDSTPLFSIKYNLCHEKGLEYFGSPVCETTHYLSITMYTNSCSEIFRTLFVAHIV